MKKRFFFIFFSFFVFLDAARITTVLGTGEAGFSGDMAPQIKLKLEVRLVLLLDLMDVFMLRYL